MKHYVPEPDNQPFDEEDESMEGVDPPTIPINVWILQEKALDGIKLITTIERGPRGVYYFCTSEENLPEMKEYIDSLDSIIRTQFGYEEHDEITDGHLITRKFQKKK
eukprot:6643354-Ditylum_brightwellii.AAC.1